MTAGIALCHEWVTTWGGSERVSREMVSALDIENVYTFVADPQLARKVFGGRNVTTATLGQTSFARDHWQWLLPAMSRWWRSLDLSAYEIVLTCSHSVVNSVQVREGAVLVSYCCTPMRYAWDWRSESRRLPVALRPMFPVVASALRRADRRRAKNVDLFLADSSNVADRIRRAYGKDSIVMYPPVDTNFFTPGEDARDEMFLFAGRLVAYKRPDLAVRAATNRGLRLVVAGSGPELGDLQRIAGSTVEFVIDPSDTELRSLYRRARALVFPGVEDFGIVPVEAQACGTPVIAFAAGGALETVRHGETGVLYTDPSVDALAETMASFDNGGLAPGVIRHQAELFSHERFDERMRTIVIPLASSPAHLRSAVIDELLRDHGRLQ